MTGIGKFIVTGIAALALAATPALAQSLAKRQHRQMGRINQGIAEGQINRNEARSLKRSQSRIHSEIRQDRVDGGGMTARERGKANRMLDRQSNRITRARHNNR